jgi:hypothetical protein
MAGRLHLQATDQRIDPAALVPWLRFTGPRPRVGHRAGGCGNTASGQQRVALLSSHKRIDPARAADHTPALAARTDIPCPIECHHVAEAKSGRLARALGSTLGRPSRPHLPGSNLVATPTCASCPWK